MTGPNQNMQASRRSVFWKGAHEWSNPGIRFVRRQTKQIDSTSFGGVGLALDDPSVTEGEETTQP